jgi:hypothetical protein
MRPSRVEPTRPSLEQRIAACRWMFDRYGVQSIDLRTIAMWTDSTEQAVRKLYPTVDDLIAAFVAREMLDDRTFPMLQDDGKTDPLVQLRNFLRAIEDAAFNNYYGRYHVARIACHLTEKHPKSRDIISRAKNREILLMATLCHRAGCRDPEVLADKLYLLVEGARWGLEVFGPEGPTEQLVAAAEDLFAAHIPKAQ